MADHESLGRLEDVLGRVLVLGVTASAATLAAGLAVTLAGGHGHVLLKAGLVLLMATPILRVAVSLVEYARMRDWAFAGATAAVLLVLFTSIGLALAR